MKTYDYCTNATELLLNLELYIRSLSQRGPTFMSVYLENFAAKIMGIFYNYEFINMNYRHKNFARIDLYNEEYNHAVQFTTERNNSEKVIKSIENSSRFHKITVFFFNSKKTETIIKHVKEKGLWKDNVEVISLYDILSLIEQEPDKARELSDICDLWIKDLDKINLDIIEILNTEMLKLIQANKNSKKYIPEIYIPEVKLFSPYEGGLHERCGTMYLLRQNEESEEYAIKKEMCIKQQHIAGHEGEILSDIAARKLYVRHLPESYRSGRHIDAARFVMITAAFEWEFRRLYPDGVPKSSKRIEAEKEVSLIMQELIDNNTGRKKDILKFLIKLVGVSSLKTEIEHIGRELLPIIDGLGQYLYKVNNQVLDYTQMGDRLSQQRNHFAHGDLEQDFIGLSLLDLMFMEEIVYAMQLKYYGIGDKQIQRIIKELFHLPIHID